MNFNYTPPYLDINTVLFMTTFWSLFIILQTPKLETICSFIFCFLCLLKLLSSMDKLMRLMYPKSWGLATDALSLATDCPSDTPPPTLPYIVICNKINKCWSSFLAWFLKTLATSWRIRVIRMSFIIYNKSLYNTSEFMLVSDFGGTSSPMVKIFIHCRGHGFIFWSGN